MGTLSALNRSAIEVAEVPPGVLTVTSNVPAAAGGDVAWIDVAETTLKTAELAPKLTAVAPLNPVPVTVTTVPPAVGPALGVTPVTAGAVL